MRLRQLPSLLLLLLFPYSSVATAFVASEEAVASTDGKELGPPPDLSANPASKPGVDAIGTKDAPVDGKDGRPHLGPFVETGAERDRKKAKENSGDIDIKKPVPEGVPTGDGAKIPETNDGVMDDPHRTGPKEGTRGTEGGISEKNKDRKATQSDGAKSEKKPDPPKEVPPLPHSEQESLDPKAAKDEGKKSKETGTEDKDKQKELGGLEVRFILRMANLDKLLTKIYLRNLPTSLKNLMTFPILFRQQRPRATLSQFSRPSHLPSPCSPVILRLSSNRSIPLSSPLR